MIMKISVGRVLCHIDLQKTFFFLLDMRRYELRNINNLLTFSLVLSNKSTKVQASVKNFPSRRDSTKQDYFPINVITKFDCKINI